MTDVYKEGTTDLLLRDTDPKGRNWYAAYLLTTRGTPGVKPQNCQEGTQYCAIWPPPNLALAAGDAYDPLRRDWFVDVNGDGLPDSVSIPDANKGQHGHHNVFGGDHPYVSINTGNGFDAPVQVLAGAPPRGDSLTIFDFDGNGTQDFIYTNMPKTYGAVAWLPVQMHGDRKTQIVQPWDNGNKLGMTLWAPNASSSFSEAWESRDLSQGSGAVAWLTVDMQGDGRTEIVQLWSYQNKLSIFVWAPNSDDGY